VLPAVNRMRRSDDFTAVVRSGSRARRGCVVVHHSALAITGTSAPIVGFVVGKSVGGSVIRHRVARRLRAQMAQRLDRLPPSSGTVVRALPEAASLESARIGSDLDAALFRLVGSP